MFLSLPSKATVRAAVYTEVKIIDRVDFIRTISNYPIALSYLRDRILYRIKATKRILISKEEESVELEIEEKKPIVPIKVFKDRLLERQKKSGEKLLCLYFLNLFFRMINGIYRKTVRQTILSNITESEN